MTRSITFIPFARTPGIGASRRSLTWAIGINLLHVHALAFDIVAARLSVLLSLILSASALPFALDARRQARLD